ncbi:MAG TPA: hypothetical protein VK399_14970 [Longimicrobiaceae bacterium]|nr:hypothetical protein [Longimicrobiaceae bacterium]
MSAQAFLSALDDGRWSDAAELIDSETAERFWRQHVELLRLQERVSPSGGAPMSETVLRGPAELAGVRSAAELEALSPVELLARFAEALDLARAMHGEPEVGPPGAGRESAAAAYPRLLRTVLGSRIEDEATARVEYRTGWIEEGRQNPAPGEIHTLTLRYTPRGWRVRGADLTGIGEGRIWLPDEVFTRLRAAFGGS